MIRLKSFQEYKADLMSKGKIMFISYVVKPLPY